MKIYNPSPEAHFTAFNGIKYLINPGTCISLNTETAEWILERWAFVGIVDITANPDIKDMQSHVIRQTLHGLNRYIESLHHRIDQFIELDTEMKQANQHGTILKHKAVKRTTELLEIASKMVKDIENKYGISLAKSEIDEKTNVLLTSIDLMISEFENDADAQKKAKEEEKSVDTLLESMIPDIVKSRFNESRV
jgi:hypothetical protein